MQIGYNVILYPLNTNNLPLNPTTKKPKSSRLNPRSGTSLTLKIAGTVPRVHYME